MGRSRPFWSKTASLTTTPSVIYLPDGWREVKVSVNALCYGQVGASYTAPAVGATNGVTTLTSLGGATDGTFTLLVFPGTELAVETGELTFDESSADVETALTNTGLFAGGDITNAGGTLDSAAITLTWTGVYAATVPPIALGTNSLTGGTNPTVQVRTTTVPDGNGGYGYLAADVQEVWSADALGNRHDRFLYLATVASTGTAYVTVYR